MSFPASRRPRFSFPLLLTLLVYLAALAGLGGYLFWPRSEPTPLRVTSARLAPEGDRILVEGEGFGPTTQVSLALDVNNRRMLRHSVPTFGRGGEMVRVGSLAYALVQKKGLLIFDLSEPQRPLVLSTFVLQEMMRAVVVEAGIAYIACDQAGLVLVDVRDPSAPRRLGSLPELVRAQGLAVGSGRLYAAVTGGKVPSALAVVDVSNPRQPRQIGRVPLPGQPLGVTLWRERLLVAAGRAGLVEMTVEGGLPQVKSRLELPGPAHSLVVVGEWAYVACASGGLVLVDLTGGQPRLSRHPAFAGHAIRLVHEAGQLYVANALYPGQVFDLERPERPQWIGAFPGSGTGGLAAQDRTVFLNTSSQGVQVLDLTELAALLPPARFEEEKALRVAVENNLVVVSTQEGKLHLLARGERGDVQWLASFALKGPSSFLRIHSGHVYAYIDREGLEVVDIRNPKLPVGAGFYPVAWNRLEGKVERGHLAFSPRGDLGVLVGSFGELMLFDTAGPNRLVLRPGPQLPEPIYKVAWGEDYLYAVTYEGSRIIPIDLPAFEPARVYPALALPTQVVRDLALMGKVLVVACGLEGLLTVDLSAPAAPRLLAVQPLPINADFLQLVGTTAHVADGRGGFMQLDLSDPARPRSAGLLIETGELQGFAVTGTQAFLAAGYEGLQIVPLPQALQPLSRDARNMSLALPPIDTPGHYTLRVTDGEQSVALDGVLKLGGGSSSLAKQAQTGLQ